MIMRHIIFFNELLQTLPESGSTEGFQTDILFSEAVILEGITFALSSVYSHS